MSRTLSGAFVNAAMAQQTEEVMLLLLTIDHDDFSTPIRVVNNTEDVTSNGNSFVAYPFEIDIPGDTADTPPRVRLRIDNVDRQIVQAVRDIASPPTMKLEVILASDPDTIEISFDNLKLKNVTYDVFAVEGELAWEDILNNPYPYHTFTPSSNPGLF